MKKNEIIGLILNFPKDIWSNPKRRNATQSSDCEYCGKKAAKNPLHVHIMTNGIMVPKKIKEKHLEKIGQQSQGCFPIHDECAKEIFGDSVDKYCYRFND